MTDKPGWGKSVLGWFVVDAGAEAAAHAEAAPADPSAPVPEPAPVLDGPLTPVVNGAVDFAQVFASAGVEGDAQEQVEKARALLGSLPAETPDAVKKQIVEASLKAFGVPIARIIAAALAELRALEAYLQSGRADLQKTVEAGTQRLAALEAEMGRVRQAVQDATAEQDSRARAVNAEKLRVQPILEFFGQAAVAKVDSDSKH